jgi:hypothetical protein
MEQDIKKQVCAADSNVNHDCKGGSSMTTIAPIVPDHPLSELSSLRKNAIYFVCCLAIATDALVATALMTTTELIARDEDLTSGGNAIWILSASAMTFAAFMPLGGRLADVSPPQWWFVSGSLGLSVCAVGNSFGEYFSDLPRRDSEKDEQLSHPVVLRASPLDHSPS